MVNTSNLPSCDEAMAVHQTISEISQQDIADILGIDSQAIEAILARIYDLLATGSTGTDLTPVLTALSSLLDAINSQTSNGIAVVNSSTPLTVDFSPTSSLSTTSTIDPASIRSLLDGLAADVVSFKNDSGTVIETTPTNPLPVTLAGDVTLNVSDPTTVLTVSLNQASLDALENITATLDGEVLIKNTLSDPTDPASAPVDLIVSLGDELGQLTTALGDISSVLNYTDDQGNPSAVTAANPLPVDVDLSGITVTLGGANTTLNVALDAASIAAINPVKVINQTSIPTDPTSTPVPLTVQLDSTSLVANPLPISFPNTAFDNLITRFLNTDGSIASVSSTTPLPVTFGGATGTLTVELDSDTIAALLGGSQRIINATNTSNQPIDVLVSLADELTTITNAIQNGGVTRFRLPDASIQDVSAANPLPVDVDLSGISVTLGGSNTVLRVQNNVDSGSGQTIPLNVKLDPADLVALEDITVTLPTDPSGNQIPLLVNLTSWVNQFTAPDNSITKVSAANPLPVTLGTTGLSTTISPSSLTDLTNAINNAVQNPQPVAYKDSSDANVPVSATSPLPIFVAGNPNTPTPITANSRFFTFAANSIASSIIVSLPRCNAIDIINNSAVIWYLTYPGGVLHIPPYGSISIDHTNQSSVTNFQEITAGNFTFTPHASATNTGRTLQGSVIPHLIINFLSW